jgi:CRISPR/Cas system-associated exonuclease Cas4 (RecB family)
MTVSKPKAKTTKAKGHEDRLHALCSASGAERWLNCPGSVGLSRTVPEKPPGPAALEGTRAHELAEKILKRWEADGRPAEIDRGFLTLQRSIHAGEVELEMPNGEMWGMVDFALSYVAVCIDEVKAFDGEASMRLEQRLAFNVDMGMFGTADFIATGTKGGRACGVIVDLKYGKKRVKVEDNPQLAYYACALAKMSKKDLRAVKVCVVQPRIGHWLSEVEYSLEELKEWNKKLTLGAEKALLQINAEKPELKTGGWCWFCPANEVCPEKIKQQGDCFDEYVE